MKCLLTVAGLDPSGGAGLSMDLAVFGSRGFHGLSVPTALVIQGPRGVEAVRPTANADFTHALAILGQQVEELAGVKVSVILSQEQTRVIAQFLREHPSLPVVVDPVIKAKNGFTLTPPEAIHAMVQEIFPLGPIVTPNLSEAAALTGLPVTSPHDMEQAARVLLDMGAKAVVVTGGHLAQQDSTTDLFFAGGEVFFYTKAKLAGEIHGTGCLFSALLLTELAHGLNPEEAFQATELEIGEILAAAYPLGPTPSSADSIDSKGYLYVNPALIAGKEYERARVLASLREAALELAELAPVELVPAVQMNLGFALPEAREPGQVAAFPGRIGVHGGKLIFKDEPAFGASSHVARLILTAMRRFPHLRACLNVKLNDRLLEKARAAGFVVLEAERAKEPPAVSETEGKSLDFLMEQVLANVEHAPDIVFDRGALGKEPMIRLFGRTPQDVIKKLKAVRP
ncbi:MAG: PfkB family carbohydrate kinase [Thermoleophilia bacterium]|nr:PfkB family carbohydrate kinase [Thermoleophilia bacterium]